MDAELTIVRELILTFSELCKDAPNGHPVSSDAIGRFFDLHLHTKNDLGIVADWLRELGYDDDAKYIEGKHEEVFSILEEPLTEAHSLGITVTWPDKVSVVLTNLKNRLRKIAEREEKRAGRGSAGRLPKPFTKKDKSLLTAYDKYIMECKQNKKRPFRQHFVEKYNKENATGYSASDLKRLLDRRPSAENRSNQQTASGS